MNKQNRECSERCQADLGDFEGAVRQGRHFDTFWDTSRKTLKYILGLSHSALLRLREFRSLEDAVRLDPQNRSAQKAKQHGGARSRNGGVTNKTVI